MDLQPNIASTAYLIADPARAAMLVALLDGHPRRAGELAFLAGVTAQTASSHLAKLLAGGLVQLEAEGRCRYYRLGGTHVAMALENLALIVGPATARQRKPANPEAQKLQFARCCYDHLAGRVSIAVTQGLQQRGFIVATADKTFDVTSAGTVWFARLGLDVAALKPGRRGIARQCLDWTERDYHLAGPLGTRFLDRLCTSGWLRRASSSRAVSVTPKGWAWFRTEFGIDENLVPLAA